MDLSKLIAISGKSGLFEVISQTPSGLIVQSLEDGRKFPVFSSTRSSVLEDISVFTTKEDIPLKEVLLKIFDKEEGKACPSPKEPAEKLKTYFAELLPEYDKERVYLSDMKKVLSWYLLLLEKNMIHHPEKEEEKDPKAASGKTKEIQTSPPDHLMPRKELKTDRGAKPRPDKTKGQQKIGPVKK